MNPNNMFLHVLTTHLDKSNDPIPDSPSKAASSLPAATAQTPANKQNNRKAKPVENLKPENDDKAG
jgi:hypothetical protein